MSDTKEIQAVHQREENEQFVKIIKNRRIHVENLQKEEKEKH